MTVRGRERKMGRKRKCRWSASAEVTKIIAIRNVFMSGRTNPHTREQKKWDMRGTFIYDFWVQDSTQSVKVKMVYMKVIKVERKFKCSSADMRVQSFPMAAQNHFSTDIYPGALRM
jgi:hypothetical protein